MHYKMKVHSSPMDDSKCFTLHSLADLLIPAPTRLLWEAFSHATIALCEDYSLTYCHNRTPTTRYSSVQLNKLGRRGENENGTTFETATRGIHCLAPRFSRSLPLLKQLHWLPVNYRIKFKLSTLTYRALAIHQPPYLASLLHYSNVPRQLRSSTSQQLSIPRTKLSLGKRAFSVAAPIIWNELPTTLI